MLDAAGFIWCIFHGGSTLNNVIRTRQIIRYRATATLRRLQIKQYTAPNEGGGYKINSMYLMLSFFFNFDLILNKWIFLRPGGSLYFGLCGDSFGKFQNVSKMSQSTIFQPFTSMWQCYLKGWHTDGLPR